MVHYETVVRLVYLPDSGKHCGARDELIRFLRSKVKVTVTSQKMLAVTQEFIPYDIRF